MLERKHDALAGEREPAAPPDLEAALDDDVGDDLLRLVLIACHPVLSTDARVALTLRLLGGLTTDEIARAFLVPEPTIAQRIVRAKRTLAEARVPFEVPRGAELAARLPSVLEVVYLIFNEGYAATRGDDWMRTDAVRRRAALGPHPRRARARRGRGAWAGGADGAAGVAFARRGVGPAGEPILLLEQDRSRWDRLLVHAGSRRWRAPRRSAARSGRTRCRRRSPRATRARATADATDWPRIVALYDALVELDAVAGGRAEPRGGGGDGVRSRGRARARRRAGGRAGAARAITCCRACAAISWRSSDAPTRRAREFERAARMTQNVRERQLLLARAKR